MNEELTYWDRYRRDEDFDIDIKSINRFFIRKLFNGHQRRRNNKQKTLDPWYVPWDMIPFSPVTPSYVRFLKMNDDDHESVRIIGTNFRSH